MPAGLSRFRLPPAPWTALACILAVIVVGVPTLRAPILTALCIAIAFYRLDWAMLLWLWCAALAPSGLIRVRNSTIVLTTAVLSVMLVRWGLMRLRRGDLSLPRSRLTIPLLAVALTAVASAVAGALFYDRAVQGVHRYLLVQVYAAALVVLSIAAAFFVNEQIQSRRILVATIATLVALGMILTLQALPAEGLLQTPRWYKIIICCAFSIVYAVILLGQPSTWWQWLLSLLAVALVVRMPAASFIFHESQWISGWVMLGIPFFLLPIIRFPRIMVPATILAAIISCIVLWPRVEHAFAQARREGDFARLIIWQDALLISGMRPMLGTGPGNYIDYAERYAEVGIALSSAHGNYQQLIAEMGILGLGFVLWLLWRLLATAWHVFRHATDPLARVIGLATIGTIAGQAGASVMGDYLFPSYHNGGHGNISATIYTWIMVGILMSVERMMQTEQRASAPQPVDEKKEGVVLPPPLRVSPS